MHILHIDNILRDDSRHAQEFFYTLLEIPLKLALEIPLNSLEFPRHGRSAGKFDAHTFRKMCDGDWMHNYHQIPLEAEQYLIQFINDDSVVIGYEMPPWITKIFDRSRVRYIDVRISPMRFASDLYIALRSNDAKFQNNIERVAIDDSELFLEASLLRASIRNSSLIRGEPRAEVTPGHPATVVFIGQTESDSSLISDDGKKLTVSDFPDEIREFSTGKYFQYKPHPYGGKFCKFEKSAIERIINKRVDLTKSNIYELFTNNVHHELLTISSGVAQEARYFGRSAEILFRPVCKLKADAVGEESFFHLIRFSDFVSPAVWHSVLHGQPPPQNFPRPPMNGANAMRHLYNAWWGYDDFMFENYYFWRRIAPRTLNLWLTKTMLPRIRRRFLFF